MPLQSQVNLSVAPGVAGDKATPGQSIYTPLNPLAAVALPVGRFVFPVVDHALMYVVALAAGSIVGAVILSLLKKTRTE